MLVAKLILRGFAPDKHATVNPVMATLLYFLRSLAIALLVGFMLSLSGLVSLLSGLTMLEPSPLGAIAQPLGRGMREFLAAFGGGNSWEGAIAIALTIGVVAALWSLFEAYKHKQRDSWRMTRFQSSNS